MTIQSYSYNHDAFWRWFSYSTAEAVSTVPSMLNLILCLFTIPGKIQIKIQKNKKTNTNTYFDCAKHADPHSVPLNISWWLWWSKFCMRPSLTIWQSDDILDDNLDDILDDISDDILDDISDDILDDILDDMLDNMLDNVLDDPTYRSVHITHVVLGAVSGVRISHLITILR